MSKQAKLEMNSDVLNVVDSWLGGNDDEKVESKQPVFEKRPQRLGLGAKYVPHKKVCFIYFWRSWSFLGGNLQ